MITDNRDEIARATSVGKMRRKKRVVVKNEISYLEIESFMLIRRGTKKDSEECMRLYELDNEKYWEISDFRNSAEHADAIFLVAEENGRVVGYILGFILPTRRKEALLIETRVHKEERRRRIGTSLVDAFCREAFAMGAKTVGALIEPQHLQFYRDACDFKEVHKWIEVGRKKEN